MIGNVEETSKIKLDFESSRLPPLLQASLQSHSAETYECALPDYCWRTGPRESVGERNAAHCCQC